MQTTVLIYRLEDKELRGPYSNGGNMLTASIDARKHPSPYKDTLLVNDFESRYIDGGLADFTIPRNYKFGFSSMGQLRAWLYDDEWLEDLHIQGYTLSIYEIERNAVAIGYSQVMFNSDKATLLRAESILVAFGLTIKEEE